MFPLFNGYWRQLQWANKKFEVMMDGFKRFAENNCWYAFRKTLFKLDG